MERRVGDAFSRFSARLLRDESGQDLIEYALVGALISLGAVASIKALAPVISNAFNTVGTKLSSNV
jgi:pilus assembly protein Flp/PilA